MREEIKVGQVWTYETRPGEEASEVLVVAIDKIESFGKIISVRVSNLAIRDKSIDAIIADSIDHIPIEEKCCIGSLLSIKAHSKSIVPSEEYYIWREEAIAGEAGAWNLQLSEVINLIEESINTSNEA